MRITFGEIRLFNDDQFLHKMSFIFNGKDGALGSGGERTRERESVRDGEWVKRVAAWVIKLDRWSSVHENQETG